VIPGHAELQAMVQSSLVRLCLVKGLSLLLPACSTVDE
jgi:hypothetical protein